MLVLKNLNAKSHLERERQRQREFNMDIKLCISRGHDQGMVEVQKACIADVRESTARGIWRSPEQGK